MADRCRHGVGRARRPGRTSHRRAGLRAAGERVIDLLLKASLAYLVGSILGSMVMGRLRGVDIRTAGSGNAGGTNAFRTQGWRFALPVVLIDIGKGAFAAGALPQLQFPGAALSYTPAVLSLVCAVACVLGHLYPLFFGFRGGKGAATFVGATLVVLPGAVLWLLLIWIGTLVLTGYVSLATLTAAVLYPVLTWLLAPQPLGPQLVYALACCALVVFAHRSNVVRLARGSEHRFEKAMFWRH
ncbi:MAG: glycerol-3-phosphate 1-O-acyltransferase PlsY [Gammaproteobacteria bacterium]|nr:glycerol-3-phosphate 1-O-acyltransferase PlsY [Gammaproteobacteria bacterium]